MTDETETITLGGGCFWCVEATFKRVSGIEDLVSGYAGGDTPDPTYEEVCAETTGHAEVVQVTFDPDAITLEEILEVFFATHDPTTKNRQGPDVGTQYRSIVLYEDDGQRERVEAFVEAAADDYDDPIVTEVVPLETFWRAEEYHQDYYAKNPNQPYCMAQIPPKLEKLEAKFADRLVRAE
jgi:peptide-methionine (S)-S-oxide reductase